jgi:hypothetical protein
VQALELYRGDQLLGTLTHTTSDMFWHDGTFDATAAFEQVRPMFDRERELLEADRMDEWEGAWREIAALGLRLVTVAGRPEITEFLLHVDGSQARWRIRGDQFDRWSL